jgi:hypothetical protein
MFERIGNLAEAVATNGSRRGFFGWAGKSALALAGLLAFRGMARAGDDCTPVPCQSGLKRCTSGLAVVCCP